MKFRVLIYGSLGLFLGITILLLINPVFPPAHVMDTSLQADPQTLRKHVEFLTRLKPARSHKNTNSLNQAARYIRDEFIQAGLAPTEQFFQVDREQYANISVLLGPRNGTRLIIGAHYDSCCNKPGADDNASGVAGLLELGRIFERKISLLHQPVELVAFSLEEPPHFGDEGMGSHFHSRELLKDKIPVRLMISLEMIGYFSEQENSQDYPLKLFSLLYPSRGNYIGMVGRFSEWHIMRKLKKSFLSKSSLPLRTVNAPALIPGFDYSDHKNYWSAGFPAIMITDTAFMRNPNYHQNTDLPETLDYERMAEVVRGVAAMVLDLQEN